jgi:peptide chain release factor 2
MAEIKTHKHWLSQYKTVKEAVDEVEVLLEFYESGDVSEDELDAKYTRAVDIIEDVEFKSTLNKPEDELSSILEINAGAGGTESCDWAEMLLRMYIMWGEKSGFKVSELWRQNGDVAGIKSAGLEIDGDFVYGVLKGENGVHRLVRVSPFNSQGKRMTSFASVFVHPLVDDSIEVDVNPADLEWDTFRSSGAGGQHVNKTDSAVRVRHLPSGIVVECQQERSQHMNRDKAMQMLRSRLYEKELQKQRAERQKVEAGKMKNEWGSQIRSYVLDDRRVKDHRTQHQTGNTDAVLDGDLDAFLKAYLMWEQN